MLDNVYGRPGDRLLAPCGLDCSNCDAYMATQSGDPALLDAVGEKWRAEYKLPSLPASALACDGCTAEGKRLSVYCSECTIRACALGRAVLTCAHCPEYSCTKLEAFLAQAPIAQKNLEDVRRWLK